jgi:putative PIN family toxin of toxin-antitoxin system
LRVFLDTNVLVAAYATRGICADVVRLVLGEHELLIGEVVLEELEAVMARKLKLPEAYIREALSSLREKHVEPHPETIPNVNIRDPDDALVLASALAADADLLVTGDEDLLVLPSGAVDLVIVTPRQFWELHRGTPERSTNGD